MLLIHSLLAEFTSRNRHGIFWCFPRKLVEIDVKAVAMMNNARIPDPVWPELPSEDTCLGGQRILLEGKASEQKELWVMENFLPKAVASAGN